MFSERFASGILNWILSNENFILEFLIAHESKWYSIYTDTNTLTQHALNQSILKVKKNEYVISANKIKKGKNKVPSNSICFIQKI